MAQKVNVGLVGYQFMGKAHSRAYRDVWRFFSPGAVPVMKAICGRTESAVSKAAEEFGWEGYETSWERLVKRDDIDLVDISTPGNTHREIAVGAAKAGKDILCEKPLANNLSEAREMLQAAQEGGVKHMIGFNYRRVPAVSLAKRLIDEGRIGKIYHWRAVYLQDFPMDPEFPLLWRFQKEKAGSGPHGDLNAHIIDLSRYLVGDITEVTGTTETFIKERPLPEDAKKKGKVTVEDAALFLARFANGALGSFEATRFAGGRKNHNRFEINGSKGSIAFNLENLNELEFFSREDEPHLQGFRRILATDPSHPYMSAWWPPGHILGWEHTFIHEIKDLLDAISEDRMPSPSFEDGVKCQAVLEAVLKSVQERSWVKVEEV